MTVEWFLDNFDVDVDAVVIRRDASNNIADLENFSPEIINPTPSF